MTRVTFVLDFESIRPATRKKR